MTSASTGASPSPEASLAPPLADPEVDLATFAAVQAAIAEGFTEEEVLAHHRVAAPAWTRSRGTWTQRLVEEGQGGPSFVAYRGALHRREDELGREVAPIDRDLDAWLGFLAAMAVEDPASLLGRTALRLPDLSRLSRGWASRFAGDPALERRAAEKREAGPEARVPELRLGTSRLVTEGKAQEAATVSAEALGTDLASFEELTVAEYVAIVARLERPGNLLRSVLRTRNVDERVWLRERARIEAAAAVDPVFRREIAVLMSFERSRLDVARSPARAPSVPPPPRDAPPRQVRASAPPPPPHVAADHLVAPPLAPPSVPPSVPPPAPPRAAPSIPPPAPTPTTLYAFAAHLPQDLLEGENILDQATSMADEATAFELPFALSAAGALPFAGVEVKPPASARPSFPPLSIALEDHARLHVELNAGYDEAEVLYRYGVNPSTRSALDAQVDDLKRRDPLSAAAWLDVYQAHAAWLLAVDGADA